MKLNNVRSPLAKHWHEDVVLVPGAVRPMHLVELHLLSVGGHFTTPVKSRR